MRDCLDDLVALLLLGMGCDDHYRWSHMVIYMHVWMSLMISKVSFWGR
jgi:hypothetical protein